MNRCIFVDIGNTSIKAVVLNNDVFDPKVVSLDSPSDFFKWYDDHRLGNEKVYVASVVKATLDELKELIPEEVLIVFNHGQIPSNLLDYETPETLGIDRFLSCLGAYSKSNSSVIVIDAGTACTVDYMDRNQVFHGGVIMPGLQTIHKSIQARLPELPEVDFTLPQKFPGKTSIDSFKWGSNGMMKAALEYYIAEMKKEDNEAKVYISGGDANAVAELISEGAEVDRKLLFEGMKLFRDLFIDKS